MAPTPMHPRTLLSAAAETGAAVAVVANTYNWWVYGTWDGATAQLQESPDGGSTWANRDGIVLTETGTEPGWWSGLQINAGHVRVVITNAGGSTSLSSDLRGVA